MQMNCGCTFQGIGMPLNNQTCRPHKILKTLGYEKHVHPKPRYRCEDFDANARRSAYSGPSCGCLDYAPRRAPRNEHDWPLCVCGHAAVAHN